MERVESGGLEPARVVGEADLAFEYMLNALRLTAGFTEADFTAATGLAFASVAAAIDDALRLGLLRRLGGGAWRPTCRGRRFLDDLQALFLPRPAGLAAGGETAAAGYVKFTDRPLCTPAFHGL
jgi:oxygen-independent coproporphyrinogen-3 oxidase